MIHNKKIVILSSYTPSLFWFRVDMMIEMKNKGYSIIAVGNDNDTMWKEKFQEIGIEYASVFVVRNGINPLYDLKSFFSIYKCLRGYCPDKLFVYQAKTIIYGTLASRLLGIKEIYILLAGLGSVIRGSGFLPEIIKFIMKKQYKLACNIASKVIFQNIDDKETFLREKIVKTSKCEIINGSGVNLKKFLAAPLPKLTTFLFVGRLIRDKGIVEYLEACRIVKSKRSNINCLLVGPFDSNPSAISVEFLKSYIDENVVSYFGETTDVRPFLKQSSVFVLPSYHEGTPKSVLEAMATKRAIITTDAPGCRETVVDNVTGFLVPIRDVDVLAERMIYLVDHPEIVQAMAEKSYALCILKYDVDKVNEKILSILGIK